MLLWKRKILVRTHVGQHKEVVINSISHRTQERPLGRANSPWLCCAPAVGTSPPGATTAPGARDTSVCHSPAWPLLLYRHPAARLLRFPCCLSSFRGDCTFWWLLVISCQIFSLENIVLKLSRTGLCWNGNCTCWKSPATQSFKLRNGVIYNVVIFIAWIYFILSINTSIRLLGRKHIENTYLVQRRK